MMVERDRPPGMYRDRDAEVQQRVDRGRFGAVLLDAVIEYDDAHGHLANATADELRDALRLGASRLRERSQRTERDPLLRGARRLVAEVWDAVHQHALSARSLVADAALDLRDTIDS